MLKKVFHEMLKNNFMKPTVAGGAIALLWTDASSFPFSSHSQIFSSPLPPLPYPPPSPSLSLSINQSLFPSLSAGRRNCGFSPLFFFQGGKRKLPPPLSNLSPNFL